MAHLSSGDILKSLQTIEHEIGGYFYSKNRDYTFVHTESHQINARSRREYISLPTGSTQYVWHLHPPNVGSYPSFEDLTIATKEKRTRFSTYINVIFTSRCTWVLLSPNIDNKTYIRVLKQTYDAFSQYCEYLRLQNDENALRDEYVKFADFLTHKMNYPVCLIFPEPKANVKLNTSIRLMHSSSKFNIEM